MEAKLRQAQRLEAIGMLAGGIAHDFNNILAAILGYAELGLNSAPQNDPVRGYLDHIMRAGLRARDLVYQILTVSRQTEQERKPVRITPICKEIFKLLRATLPATIEIRWDMAAASDVVVADPTQIHQVIMNLCTNAAHAMREKGGLLEVALTEMELHSENTVAEAGLKAGPYLKLTVRDTGHGMGPDTVKHIFDFFYTTKENGEGTGLGLAVAHEIVENSGGAISVSSSPGLGSTFQIILPRVEQAAAFESVHAEQLPKGNERILLVDDEPELALLGKRTLEQLGYTVTSLWDSRQALRLFSARPREFDLVLTDQTMPHLTGLSLAGELQQIRADLPVVLCTGFSDQVTEEKVRAAGIRELLLKPYARREVALAVRKALRSDEKRVMKRE